MIKSVARGPFLLVSAYGLTQGFVIQMIGPVFPLFLYEDLHVQVPQVGMIVSLLSVASLLTKIPLGTWIRPKHLVPAMLLGSSTMALMPLAYSLSTNTELVILFRIIHGVATAITVTVNIAVVTSVVSKEQTQRAIVFYSTAFSAGLLLGPLGASFLVAFFGIRYSLAFSSAIAIMSPLVCVGFLRFHSLMKNQPSPKRSFAPRRIFSLIQTSAVAVSSAVVLSHSFLLGTMLAYGSLYSKLAFKLQDSQVTLLFFGLFTVSLAIRLVFTKLLATLGRAGVLALGLLAAGFSLASVGTITYFPLYVMGFIGFGLAHGLIFPTATILVADSTSVDNRALGSSMFLFCFDVGQLAGPLAIATMIPFFGLGSSLSISSTIVLFGLMSTVYLHRSKSNL